MKNRHAPHTGNTVQTHHFGCVRHPMPIKRKRVDRRRLLLIGLCKLLVFVVLSSQMLPYCCSHVFVLYVCFISTFISITHPHWHSLPFRKPFTRFFCNYFPLWVSHAFSLFPFLSFHSFHFFCLPLTLSFSHTFF